MLTVYKFGPIGDCPDISPFVIKLETWLHFAGIPYTTAFGNHGKQPLGKLPAVLDDGVVIPDSSLIIEHLERKHGDPLGEAQLTPPQRALREAVKALIESRLYWVGYCIRWCVDDNFERYKPALRHYALQTASPIERRLLPLVEGLAFRFARRQCVRQAHEEGMGRFTPEQRTRIGIDGWSAVAGLLGSGPFMFGDRPTAIDATVYGFLDGYLGCDAFRSPVHDFIASRPELVTYWQRVRERCWTQPAAVHGSAAPAAAARPVAA